LVRRVRRDLDPPGSRMRVSATMPCSSSAIEFSSISVVAIPALLGHAREWFVSPATAAASARSSPGDPDHVFRVRHQAYDRLDEGTAVDRLAESLALRLLEGVEERSLSNAHARLRRGDEQRT